MANDFYTLIVVPHAKARFRKIQFSVRLAKWAAGLTAAFFLLTTGTFVRYARIAGEVHELRHLRAENEVLAAKTHEYEESASKLQAKVQQLQTMVNKLGVMAGLDKSLPDPTIAGVGGVTGAEAKAPQISLQEMDQHLAALTDRSQRLETFYKTQSVLLS